MANIPLPKVRSIFDEKSEADLHRELENEVGIDRAFRMSRLWSTLLQSHHPQTSWINSYADQRPMNEKFREAAKRQGYSDKAIDMFLAL